MPKTYLFRIAFLAEIKAIRILLFPVIVIVDFFLSFMPFQAESVCFVCLVSLLISLLVYFVVHCSSNHINCLVVPES